jgi:hypothetical protein
MGYAGGAAAAAAAAAAQAIKASGAIIDLSPEEFSKLMRRVEPSLIVVGRGGIVVKHFRYLMSYKGFIFHTSSPKPLQLDSRAEVISSKKVWIPM